MQTVKQLRLEMRYSLAEMAEALGISKATFRTYDNGRTSPPEGLLADIMFMKYSNKSFMLTIAKRVDEALEKEPLP